MQSYRLRHRVEFQVPSEEQDSDNGAVTIVWVTAQLNGTDLNSVPAEVLTGPGSEFIEAGAKQSTIDARINLRWFPGLEPFWRVLWDGQVYNIEATSTDRTGRREWRLKCSAGVGDGQ